MSVSERAHVALVKDQPCVVCEHPPPSEAHEQTQGNWFTSIPLCADCHRGSFNGIHGQRNMWRIKKMTEDDALNEALRRMFYA